MPPLSDRFDRPIAACVGPSWPTPTDHSMAFPWRSMICCHGPVRARSGVTGGGARFWRRAGPAVVVPVGDHPSEAIVLGGFGTLLRPDPDSDGGAQEELA